MKLFVVLALVAAASAMPNYGYSAPEIRVSSYDAPIVKAAMPSYGYSAPELKTASYGYAVPELKKAPIPIVRFNLDNDHYGSFNFDHVSGDGTTVSESGRLKDLGDKEGPVSVKTGSYSYLGDDGHTYAVSWTADENGFRAVGDHLPTPVPQTAEYNRIYAEHLAAAAAAPAYSGYEAPVIRSSGYGYAAPVVRSSYAAPVVRSEQIYEAPAIRVVSSKY